MSQDWSIDLSIGYREPVDRYFWLRHANADDGIAGLRRRVREIFNTLPPLGFMLVDPAVAGHAHDPDALVALAADLPADIGGIDLRTVLTGLAAILKEAPTAPPPRRESVEASIGALAATDLTETIRHAADRLGFTFPPDTQVTIDVVVVQNGIPLAGLTGEKLDDNPICLVEVERLDRSALAETIVHEALHAIDMRCDAPTSIVQVLRRSPDSSHQLWHVPYFIAAANAVRAVLDADHVDYGHAHGYYDKVPAELAALADMGIAPGVEIPGSSDGLEAR